NIYLNGTMIGFTKEEIDERLDDILSFADIGDFIHQPCKTYSSGMFVRLAFAVAINIDPEILIVDEALSVGDVFFQAKCYHKFEEFKKAGKTILMVSHDLGSVAKYCDRVVLLNKGVKRNEGEPKEIIDEYKQILVNTSDKDDRAMIKEDLSRYLNPANAKGKWYADLEINPQVLDYGDKAAEIIDFAVVDDNGKVNSGIIKGSDFTIKMKVRFNEAMTDPLFCYTIKDPQGTEVCGTNTMLEQIDTGDMEAGSEHVVEFRQRMNLQGRTYLLSLGVVGFAHNRFNVYNRLYDVCDINVISDKNTVGFYDIESTVSIDGEVQKK
ncbi:MAG: ABC transporter ATP-binding protein, partial [Lachnospiraceae bacterium]|nr:ABC transporter ATP-binding protein [Candidatus Equihabitans merdae]